MTKPRNDSHSTEFGLWLREQPEIDSGLGFVATNVDYVWKNYKTRQWMMIEEKRFCSEPPTWQKIIFSDLSKACSSDSNFLGFHYLTFERSSPEDGAIYLDGEAITKEELIDFLKFEHSYVSSRT